VVDATTSCSHGRDRWLDELEPWAAGLTEDQPVAILRFDTRVLLWAGTRQSAGFAAAFNGLRGEQGTDTGSDPATSLAMARQWLSREELRGYRRRLLIWSDLQPDPAADGETKKPFRDPFDSLRWDETAPLEMEIYGLSVERHARLQETWGQQGARVTICPHQPGESLTSEHLGIHVSLY
jgi:hypothetical protein